jgi:DNA-binding CsgD family transcriptional regulator
MLPGRAGECAMVAGALDQARTGNSSVVLLTGEPGAGKTAILQFALGSAVGLTVVRASGVESEMELAFASLQQLCAPLLDGLASLPGPQRTAVETAFGLAAGPAPDPFFVGLGALGLLASAGPLLCVVDDVQWLDRASAQALGFVARRLAADPVALLLAGRDLSGLSDIPGAVELPLAGLADTDARALLATVASWITPKVADRIIAQTRGIPLALLELPRSMTAPELSAEFGLPDPSGLPGRIEESFRRRLAELPEPTRQLMLMAAADPTGDAMLLWGACDIAGIDAAVVGPAVDAGLMEVGAHVTFFHPLVRSAVYRAASVRDRRAAHGALAAATDTRVDPDRRAWHRGQAAAGPDEEVAAELEESASRARARGGVAAAAAFLERSVALTLDPVRRAARALAAAQARHEAGGHDAALELLELAEAGPLGDLDRARAERLRALVSYVRADGRDGAVQLLRAARRLEPLDPGLARATYIDALGAALNADPEPEVGEALAALPLSRPPQPAELLMHGWGLFFTEGFPNGVDFHRQAVAAFVAAPWTGEENIRALYVSVSAASSLWDDTGFDVLSGRLLTRARAVGTLSELPAALHMRGLFCAYAGDLDAAAAALDEAEAIRAATGVDPAPGEMGFLSALREEETAVLARIERLRAAVQVRDAIEASTVEYSLAVLYNGLARFPDALAAALRSRDLHPAGGFGLLLAELTEAAARCHAAETGQDALDALRPRTGLGGTDWALGVEAYCRAVLAPGTEAEEPYLEAIERLGRTRMRLPLARAHLLYGEWLRRERRRGEAREQLRAAHDMFEKMGARSFAGRARQELSATGITAHSRRNATLDELTPQELRIATMAGEGLPNAQIAAQLYISVGTVEYHLNKVFRKLNIRSRAQLHLILAPSASGH